MDVDGELRGRTSVALPGGTGDVLTPGLETTKQAQGACGTESRVLAEFGSVKTVTTLGEG